MSWNYTKIIILIRVKIEIDVEKFII